MRQTAGCSLLDYRRKRIF